VTIKATIKNQGTAATPAGVDVGVGFKVDNVGNGSFFVEDAAGKKVPLAAGASCTGSCNTVWTAKAGTHKIKATADDVNRFAEADENNNYLEKSFTIANVLPDVIIQDIWLEQLSSGTNYRIHARIKNNGTAATPAGIVVGVGFKVDGVGLGSFFVTDANGVKTNLAAGAIFNGVCTTQWVKKVNGTHIFLAMADDVNRFPESNEDNNARKEYINVQ
jgi:subtilase family serine protease